jgi:hypothetical protein
MTIKKLLATTAIAALAATSANALGVTQAEADGTIGNAVEANATLATEVNLGAGGTTGTFEFLVNTTTAIPAADNVKLTVSLPAGLTFTTALAGGTGPGAVIQTGDDSGDTVSGGAGDIAVLSALVSVGGGAGSSSATFLIDTDTGEKSIGLRLPITMPAGYCNAPGGINIGLSTENNTPIENGGANGATPIALATNLVTCSQALAMGAGADAADSILELTGNFINFSTPVVGDTVTTATLGATSGAIGAQNVTLVNTGGAPDPLVPGDIAAIDFDITFSGPVAGITGVTVGGIAATGPVGNVFHVSATGAGVSTLTTGGNDTIVVTIDGTTSIASQTATVGTMTATFTDRVGPPVVDFITSESFNGSALDALQREGTTFGFFDWVGDANKSSRHIFRFTGMNANAITGEVDFANCSSGQNGTFGPFTLNTVNGEGQVFNHTAGSSGNITLDSLNPSFGRCDVRFRLFSDVSATGDVDRLVLRNDILTPFGDNNNGANDATSNGNATNN